MEQRHPAANFTKPKQQYQRATPVRKYISMFRIDGVPILSPLMTTEKRRQMLKLKEKAIRLERKLEEKRRKKSDLQRYMCDGVLFEGLEADLEAAPSHRESLCSASVSSVSQHSIGTNDAKRLEVEDSYLLLSSLIKKNEEITKSHESNTQKISNMYSNSKIDSSVVAQVQLHPPDMNIIERMQRLQKSETLIYDNTINTIIMPMTADIEEELNLTKTQEEEEDEEGFYHPKRNVIDLRDVEEKANLNYLSLQKPFNYTLDKSIKKIPSICVDPPTPLVGHRTFCDAMGVCGESVDRGDEKKMHNDDKLFYDDLSSDESYNYSQSSARMDHDLKSHNRVTNITGKIIQFERYQSESTSAERRQLESCVVKPPQRSATSPSLKLDVDLSPCRTQEISSTSQSENPLVRSNSFTLDYPSKVLLDHIRQQKANTPNNNNNNNNNSCNNIIKRTTTTMPLSQSATRDTVESKAKRVQKVDLKSRTQQQTRQQTKPFVNSLSTNAITYPTNNTLLFKNKRSPYESKCSGSFKTKQTRQLKKSASNVTIKPVKSRSSVASIQHAAAAARSGKVDSARTSPVNSEILNEIEVEHRQKFLQLLAQQKDEQKRLQESFEMQQQILFEQLSAEIGRVHLQSPSCKLSERNHTVNGETLSDGDSSAAVVSSADNSPNRNSECSELPPKSPTLSMNSSVLSSVISGSTAAGGTPSAADNLPTLGASSSFIVQSPTVISVPRCTPRRRLFGREHSSNVVVAASAISLGGGVGVAGGGTNNSATSSNGRSLQDNESHRRTIAASRINAYVRGYMVRRLFQTEQVQRIVQTMRDTLIFLLKLHQETYRDPEQANTEANVKLKARLLQQMSSASRTIHFVFFQTTAKERMEVIARDRKRIKTKLLNLNSMRSPRIVGQN